MNLIWDEAGWNNWLLRDQWQCGWIKQLCSRQSSHPWPVYSPFTIISQKNVPDAIIPAATITTGSDKPFHRSKPTASYPFFLAIAQLPTSVPSLQSAVANTIRLLQKDDERRLIHFKPEFGDQGQDGISAAAFRFHRVQLGLIYIASTSCFLLSQLRGKKKEETHRRSFSTLLGTSGGGCFYGNMRTFFIAGSRRPIV